MNCDPDDDFAARKSNAKGNPAPPAPKRPVKKGDVHTKVPSTSVFGINHPYSDTKVGGDGGNLESEECLVCNKNITHLNEVRRLAHVNACLDNQESKKNFETKKERWTKTVDCPLCGEPLSPGPNRVAHVKKCGSTYKLPPKELMSLMEAQSRISEIKKKKGVPHTKAVEPSMKQLLPQKLKNEPKSLFQEETQVAMALSASLSNLAQDKNDTSLLFTRVPDPSEKRRKRPRSYAIVELAPKSCKCEVLTEMRDRFLDNFYVRKTGGSSEKLKSVCERRAKRTSFQIIEQSRILNKLSRLERLSQDLIGLVGMKDSSDYQIQCKDGILFAHRCFLQMRTTLIKKASSELSNIVEVNENINIVEFWLRFVYSARVEWSHEENERVAQLANSYGPEELVFACSRFDVKSDVVLKEKSNLICDTENNESMVENIHTKEATKDENSVNLTVYPFTVASDDGNNLQPVSTKKTSVPDELQVNLNLMDVSNKSQESMTDYENPLQGVNLVDSNNDELKSDISNDVIIIQDDDTNEPQGQHIVTKPQAVIQQHEELEKRPILNENCLLSKNIMQPLSTASYFHDLDGVDNVLTNLSRIHCSPDIFEEGSLDTVRKDNSLYLTPLRTSNHNLQDNTCSTGNVDMKLRSKSISADIQLRLNAEDININQSSRVDKSKSLLSTEIDRVDTGSSNIVDPEYFDDYLMDDYCVFLESESNRPHQISSEECCYSSRDRNSVQSQVRCDTPEDDLEEKNDVVTLRNKDKRRSKTLTFVEDKDSFFDSPVITGNNKQTFGEEDIHREDGSHSSPPVAHSTPLQPARKKSRFGSNVKVLKTVGITPMPDYDGMDDNELKVELSKYGLRPMNRKRAIIMLKRIYDEVHPVIDPSTPTVRPLFMEIQESCPHEVKPKEKQKVAKALAWEDGGSKPEQNNTDSTKPLSTVYEDPYDDGDKTLNESREEPLEETMIDDTGLLPKDFDGMKRAFVYWLRRPENAQLYNHILSLQPVILDELHLRLSRADSAVCGIPKKALATILDGLGVTFSLPQTIGRRAMGSRRGRK